MAKTAATPQVQITLDLMLIFHFLSFCLKTSKKGISAVSAKNVEVGAFSELKIEWLKKDI